jgi:hypothetical protein
MILGLASNMVIVKFSFAVLPALSVAIHVTVVVLGGKMTPKAGLHKAFKVLMTLSMDNMLP